MCGRGRSPGREAAALTPRVCSLSPGPKGEAGKVVPLPGPPGAEGLPGSPGFQGPQGTLRVLAGSPGGPLGKRSCSPLTAGLSRRR